MEFSPISNTKLLMPVSNINMKASLRAFVFSLFIITIGATSVQAQTDSVKVVVTTQPIPWNAGFDVIIKMNGEIIYGLVKEVGPQYIRYQRTDIPDGPVYYILKDEVYAISYRNQVKDFLGHTWPLVPIVDTAAAVSNVTPITPQPPVVSRKFFFKDKNMFRHGSVQVGLGFFRSFTKVKNASQYSSKFTFPVVMLGYEVNYSSNIHLGVQVGFGSHNFSTQQFDSYDSLQNNINLKENIFGLYAYGRYYFSDRGSTLRPYILGGVGVTSSNIKSDNTINFTNGYSQVLLIKSGMRTTGLGLTARVGADYAVNDQLRLSLDAGFGLSVLNVGVLVNIK